MEPEAAILEWIKPASLAAGQDGKLWVKDIDGMAYFHREDTNLDYDDKIFNLELYDSIKVDDQFYLNNPGVYLIIDNTAKEGERAMEPMRLELKYSSDDASIEVWVLQPYANQSVRIQKLDEIKWREYPGRISRSPSKWDIYYLMEYLGNARFRPLNWTQFPDSLL